MPKLHFQTTSPVDVRADVVALPIFEGPEGGPGVDDASAAMGSDLVELYRSNKLRGRSGEALSVPTFGRLPAASLLLVGLGKPEKVDADALRRGIGKVAARLARFGTVATTLPQAASDGDPGEAVQATV